jgi:hypothetical protein
MKSGRPNEPENKAELRLNQFLEERGEEKKEDLKLVEKVKKKGKEKVILSDKNNLPNI